MEPVEKVITVFVSNENIPTYSLYPLKNSDGSPRPSAKYILPKGWTVKEWRWGYSTAHDEKGIAQYIAHYMGGPAFYDRFRFLPLVKATAEQVSTLENIVVQI